MNANLFSMRSLALAALFACANALPAQSLLAPPTTFPADGQVNEGASFSLQAPAYTPLISGARVTYLWQREANGVFVDEGVYSISPLLQITVANRGLHNTRFRYRVVENGNIDAPRVSDATTVSVLLGAPNVSVSAPYQIFTASLSAPAYTRVITDNQGNPVSNSTVEYRWVRQIGNSFQIAQDFQARSTFTPGLQRNAAGDSDDQATYRYVVRETASVAGKTVTRLFSSLPAVLSAQLEKPSSNQVSGYAQFGTTLTLTAASFSINTLSYDQAVYHWEVRRGNETTWTTATETIDDGNPRTLTTDVFNQADDNSALSFRYVVTESKVGVADSAKQFRSEPIAIQPSLPEPTASALSVADGGSLMLTAPAGYTRAYTGSTVDYLWQRELDGRFVDVGSYAPASTTTISPVTRAFNNTRLRYLLRETSGSSAWVFVSAPTLPIEVTLAPPTRTAATSPVIFNTDFTLNIPAYTRMLPGSTVQYRFERMQGGNYVPLNDLVTGQPLVDFTATTSVTQQIAFGAQPITNYRYVVRETLNSGTISTVLTYNSQPLEIQPKTTAPSASGVATGVNNTTSQPLANHLTNDANYPARTGDILRFTRLAALLTQSRYLSTGRDYFVLNTGETSNMAVANLIPYTIPDSISDGNSIRFTANAPAPLNLGDTYYIVQATATTFRVAATVGGTPIDIARTSAVRWSVGSFRISETPLGTPLSFPATTANMTWTLPGLQFTGASVVEGSNFTLTAPAYTKLKSANLVFYEWQRLVNGVWEDINLAPVASGSITISADKSKDNTSFRLLILETPSDPLTPDFSFESAPVAIQVNVAAPVNADVTAISSTASQPLANHLTNDTTFSVNTGDPIRLITNPPAALSTGRDYFVLNTGETSNMAVANLIPYTIPDSISDGNSIRFTANAPVGVNLDDTYYVVQATATTFRVSSTRGGSPLALTRTSAVRWRAGSFRIAETPGGTPLSFASTPAPATVTWGIAASTVQVTEGAPFTITAPTYTPISSGSIEYLWQRQTPSGYVNIGGYGSSNALTISVADAKIHNTRFRYQVREAGDSNGALISRPIQVIVNLANASFTQGVSSATYGEVVDLSAPVFTPSAANATVSYTWQSSSDGNIWRNVETEDTVNIAQSDMANEGVIPFQAPFYITNGMMIRFLRNAPGPVFINSAWTGGAALNTDYFAVNCTASGFQISDTPGGAPIRLFPRSNVFWSPTISLNISVSNISNQNSLISYRPPVIISNGMTIRFLANPPSLPTTPATRLQLGTDYYVVNSDPQNFTFRIALTDRGAGLQLADTANAVWTTSSAMSGSNAIPIVTPLLIADGTPVRFLANAPQGLSLHTNYYAVNVTSTHFQISDTRSGTPLPLPITSGMQIATNYNNRSIIGGDFINYTDNIITPATPNDLVEPKNTFNISGILNDRSVRFLTPYYAPPGVSMNTVYYVTDSNAYSFKISETIGGAVFDFGNQDYYVLNVGAEGASVVTAGIIPITPQGSIALNTPIVFPDTAPTGFTAKTVTYYAMPVAADGSLPRSPTTGNVDLDYATGIRLSATPLNFTENSTDITTLKLLDIPRGSNFDWEARAFRLSSYPNGLPLRFGSRPGLTTWALVTATGLQVVSANQTVGNALLTSPDVTLTRSSAIRILGNSPNGLQITPPAYVLYAGNATNPLGNRLLARVPNTSSGQVPTYYRYSVVESTGGNSRTYTSQTLSVLPRLKPPTASGDAIYGQTITLTAPPFITDPLGETVYYVFEQLDANGNVISSENLSATRTFEVVLPASGPQSLTYRYRAQQQTPSLREFVSEALTLKVGLPAPDNNSIERVVDVGDEVILSAPAYAPPGSSSVKYFWEREVAGAWQAVDGSATPSQNHTFVATLAGHNTRFRYYAAVRFASDAITNFYSIPIVVKVIAPAPLSNRPMATDVANATVVERDNTVTLTAPAYVPIDPAATILYRWERSVAGTFIAVSDFTTQTSYTTPPIDILLDRFSAVRYSIREVVGLGTTQSIREFQSRPLTILSVVPAPLLDPSNPSGVIMATKAIRLVVPPYVPANDGASFQFLWERFDGSLFRGLGAFSSSTDYLISKATIANSGMYRYRVNELNGTTLLSTFTSTPIEVSVLDPVRIIKQPSAYAESKTVTLAQVPGNPQAMPVGTLELKCGLDPKTSGPINYVWQRRNPTTLQFETVPDADVVPGSGTTATGEITGGSREITLVTRVTFPSDGIAPIYRVLVSNPVTVTPVISSNFSPVLNSPPVLLALRNLQPDKTNLNLPLTILQNKTGRLSVAPLGVAPLTYTWQKRGVTGGFVTIQGSTGNSLTITGSLAETDLQGGTRSGPGFYRVLISNPLSLPTEPLQSAEVEVRVIPAPSLQPATLSVVPAFDAKLWDFSSSLTGKSLTGTLSEGNRDNILADGATVSWQRDTVSLVATSICSDQVAAGSRVVVLPSTAGLLALMEVSGLDVPGINASASFGPVDATNPPYVIERISGRTITLSRALVATLPKGARLLFKNRSSRLPSGIADSVEMDAESNYLKLNFRPLSQIQAWNLRGSYRLLVANAAGLATSAATVVNVKTDPIPPGSESLTYLFATSGRPYTLIGDSLGTPPLTYAWEFTDKRSETLPVGKAARLTRPAVTKPKDEGTYTLTVANADRSRAFNRRFFLQVDNAPALSRTKPRLELLDAAGNVAPSNRVRVGLDNRLHLRVQFSATNRLEDVADGSQLIKSNPVEVIWYRSGVEVLRQSGSDIKPVPGSAPIAGGDPELRAELIIDPDLGEGNVPRPIRLADGGSYTCIIRNLCGQVTSPAQAVVMGEVPLILTQPVFSNSQTRLTVYAETPVVTRSFTATSPARLSYQWFKEQDVEGGFADPVPLAGQTKPVLSLAAAAVAVTSGDRLFCRVTAADNLGFSETQRLTLEALQIPRPTIGIATGNTMYPGRARKTEKVIIRGSNFRFLKRVEFSMTKNGQPLALSNPASAFVVISDTSVMVTVPDPRDAAKKAIDFDGGRFLLQSGGLDADNYDATKVTSPALVVTDIYENNLANSTILPSNLSFVSVFGDNSYLADQEYRAAQLRGGQTIVINAAAHYQLTVAPRQSVTISALGLPWLGPDNNNAGDTDFDLTVQHTNNAATRGFIIGPDGVSKFVPATGTLVGGTYASQYIYRNNGSNPIDLIVRIAPKPLYEAYILFPVPGYHAFGPFRMSVSFSAPTPAPAGASASAPVENTSSGLSSGGSSVTTWQGGSVSGTDPVSGDAAVEIGGSSSSSTNLWLRDGLPAVSTGTLNQGMRLCLTGTEGGDDQFGWQLMNSKGQAVAAFWISGADGSIRLVDSLGRQQVSNQRITSGEGNWYWISLEANLKTNTLKIWIDGVPLGSDLEMPAGSGLSDLQGVWDMGPDGKPSTMRMKVSGFSSQANP